MEYIAKCPHCGSKNLGETASDLYRYHPARFTKDENGVIMASEYGRAATFIDNGSLVSDPYDCLDCGAVDMASTDLVLEEVVDEKPTFTVEIYGVRTYTLKAGSYEEAERLVHGGALDEVEPDSVHTENIDITEED